MALRGGPCALPDRLSSRGPGPCYPPRPMRLVVVVALIVLVLGGFAGLGLSVSGWHGAALLALVFFLLLTGLV